MNVGARGAESPRGVAHPAKEDRESGDRRTADRAGRERESERDGVPEFLMY